MSQTNRILVNRRRSPLVGAIDHDAGGNGDDHQRESEEQQDITDEELQDLLVFAKSKGLLAFEGADSLILSNSEELRDRDLELDSLRTARQMPRGV